MKTFLLKYLTGKLVAKMGWMGFKVAAKYTDNLYDDAIVAFKEGIQNQDMDKVEDAFEMLGKEYKKFKNKK